jgi:hypothetical protein
MKSLFVLFVFLLSYKVLACECVSKTLNEELQTPSFIFSGIIIGKDIAPSGERKWKVIVQNIWKGHFSNDTVSVYSGY